MTNLYKPGFDLLLVETSVWYSDNRYSLRVYLDYHIVYVETIKRVLIRFYYNEPN